MRRHSMEEPPVITMMLLGSTGSGKSASGNTIIGVRETFKEDFSPESVTRTCQSAQAELDGQTITVIDTVGLSDTSVKITDAQTQIEEILQSTYDGIDVFLLVIKLGETFTVENSKVVKWIQNNFGAMFSYHTIVLFTHGDQLHEPIERYLNKCETLRSYVGQCSGGFHVFNNKNEDPSQVTELLEKIESLRMMNAYKRYTEQDYKETQKALLLKKCVAEAAAVGAMGGYVGVGGSATGGGVTSIRTALTAGQAALIGAGGGVLGGIVAVAGAVIAYMMGTALTAGQATLIAAAGGTGGAGGGVIASMMGTPLNAKQLASIAAAGGAGGAGGGAIASMLGKAATMGEPGGVLGGIVAGARGVIASVMGKAATMGEPGGVLGGIVAGARGVIASVMESEFTTGQAALIAAAGGAALAAVFAGVYLLARKYNSKEKDKSN